LHFVRFGIQLDHYLKKNHSGVGRPSKNGEKESRMQKKCADVQM
jgi:hypothetical protein